MDFGIKSIRADKPMEQIKTDPRTLEKYSSVVSCGTICDHSRARGIIDFDGKKYVATGGCYQGGAILYVEVEEVVPLDRYKGKTQTYSEWSRLPDESRCGSYRRIKVAYRGKPFVFLGTRIKFLPGGPSIGEQLTLF